MKKYIFVVGALLTAIFVSACSSPNAKGTGNIMKNPHTNLTNSPIAPVSSSSSAVSKKKNNNPAVHYLSLISNESVATFQLNEVLRGIPTHVVGTSTAIIGNVTVNTDKPANISVGPIKLDATSLVTNNPIRNRSIIHLILHSDQPQNKYIVFTPKSISGVPTQLPENKPFSVKIAGNLTISGHTNPVKFSGKMEWHKDGTLSVDATTDLSYSDFGLSIPNFPFLANVDKVVKLEVKATAGANN